MTVIYRADDGKEFESEFECECYEQAHRWKELLDKSDLVIYDKDHKPIELVFGETPETDTMDDVYDNSYFIDIGNENAAQLMFEINEYYGLFFPDSVGEWKFINAEPYAGDWVKATEN